MGSRPNVNFTSEFARTHTDTPLTDTDSLHRSNSLKVPPHHKPCAVEIERQRESIQCEDRSDGVDEELAPPQERQLRVAAKGEVVVPSKGGGVERIADQGWHETVVEQKR